MRKLDVLIPTYGRPAALAVTLTSLIGQKFRDFRVVISDQTEDHDPFAAGEVLAVIRLLRIRGHAVETLKHLPRRGMAEHRQFLLDQAGAPYALFIDDDVILEPFVIDQMLGVIEAEKCGFVGSALIGPSFLDDFRPEEQKVEFWEGPVLPEEVRPGAPEWERWRLHSAANVYHLQQRLGLTPEKTRRYRVAWVGGCVMYDVDKLRRAGGFEFWRKLPPEHSGEDVLAQLRIMARYGGCGILPSGVYHQELPTTVEERSVDAPKELAL
jgi:GT2 family glycosyltransferase